MATSPVTVSGSSSGMQVPYELKPDQYGGHGIFAREDVAQGTLIWSLSKSNAKIMNDKDAQSLVESLSDGELQDLVSSSYFLDDGRFVDMRPDHGRYFNHTNGERNVALGCVMKELDNEKEYDNNDTYAKKDISAGEELLDDYNTYGDEAPWYSEVIKKTGQDHSYMNG
eukprot:m.342801 g.342801  ORF g.342801 m.342801 type:complete len:169 (-) comp21848_c0_seq1:133-639(-)